MPRPGSVPTPGLSVRPADVKRAWRVPALTSAERLVLCELADAASDDTRLAWPSRDRLCSHTGLHAKSVQLALRRLIALGYVTESKAAARGRVRTFRLHPDTWPSPPPRE